MNAAYFLFSQAVVPVQPKTSLCGLIIVGWRLSESDLWRRVATHQGSVMHFYPHERIALFIDGVSLYATAKSLEFDVDYKRLLMLFGQRAQLVRAFYYTALAEDQEYSSIRPLIDWLGYNGFSVVTKPTKEFIDASGRRKVKGNMDIEIAVQAIQLAPALDHIVLFSGDGDFRSLVADLQLRGKRVSVISTLQSSPPMIADELRRQADQFIDLADLEPIIARDPSTRPARTVGGRGARGPDQLSPDEPPGYDDGDDPHDP